MGSALSGWLQNSTWDCTSVVGDLVHSLSFAESNAPSAIAIGSSGTFSGVVRLRSRDDEPALGVRFGLPWYYFNSGGDFIHPFKYRATPTGLERCIF
jgi:hypothetical protein